MTRIWLRSLALFSAAALLATAAVGEIPSPNNPQNLPAPPKNPGNSDPKFTCTRSTLATEWLTKDTRIGNVHTALDVLIKQFGAISPEVFGPAPAQKSALPATPTPQEVAHAKFKAAMTQFNELATTSAVNTRPECKICQQVADYQILVELAKSDGEELVHSDKVRKIKVTDIDESLVVALDTNIETLRGFGREAKKSPFPSTLLSNKIAVEKDVIVAWLVEALKTKPASGPKNAQLKAWAAQYTCPGFDQ